MTDQTARHVRVIIEAALQAAEAEALQSGEIPGYGMWSQAVVDALAAARVAVIPLPELPEEDRTRGFELPGTDLSVRYRDYGDQGNEFQLWVNSPTRPSRIQKVYDAEVGTALAALILAASAAEGDNQS